MKTSFAKTFSDLSKNMESKNELSDEKQTYRKITDENDDSLTDDIYVVESYNENYESKEMSTLLVNRDLQTEYAEITNKILELKDKLLNKMKLSAGIRKDIEQIIVDDFSVNNFYKILDMFVFHQIVHFLIPYFCLNLKMFWQTMFSSYHLEHILLQPNVFQKIMFQ